MSATVHHMENGYGMTKAQRTGHFIGYTTATASIDIENLFSVYFTATEFRVRLLACN